MAISFTGVSNDDFQTAYGIQNTKGLENKLGNVSTEEDEKMLEACKEFEAYMLEQVYKQMDKTVMRADEEKSDYENYFGDMRIQEFAKRATDQGGVGLAQQLYESMKRQAEGLTPEQVNRIEDLKAAEVAAAATQKPDEA